MIWGDFKIKKIEFQNLPNLENRPKSRFRHLNMRLSFERVAPQIAGGRGFERGFGFYFAPDQLAWEPVLVQCAAQDKRVKRRAYFL